jgi:magnesium-transporting ATPase (P-type)
MAQGSEDEEVKFLVFIICLYPYKFSVREQAESDLKFLGLTIFENKLKSGTASVIQTLRTAQLACRMVTGDNPLTAVSVARECNLVNPAAHVFFPVFIRGFVHFRFIYWCSVLNPWCFRECS